MISDIARNPQRLIITSFGNLGGKHTLQLQPWPSILVKLEIFLKSHCVTQWKWQFLIWNFSQSLNRLFIKYSSVLTRGKRLRGLFQEEQSVRKCQRVKTSQGENVRISTQDADWHPRRTQTLKQEGFVFLCWGDKRRTMGRNNTFFHHLQLLQIQQEIKIQKTKKRERKRKKKENYCHI